MRYEDCTTFDFKELGTFEIDILVADYPDAAWDLVLFLATLGTYLAVMGFSGDFFFFNAALLLTDFYNTMLF